MRLEGKRAVVTGGNSGIGRAAVERFAAEGAAVMVAARDPVRSANVVAAVRAAGGVAEAVTCDVRDAVACDEAVAAAVAAFGGIDILFNNAGIIFRERTAPDTTTEEWQATMAVNATGTFLMSRAVVPAMITAGGGSIVNNASYFGLVGGRGAAAYCASKGAVVLLTKAMALDHAGDGIRANCIAPGSVDTPMLQGEMEAMGGEDAVRRLFEEKHPLGRIATPDEIAEAVVYLVSDEAGFVTGSTLTIDGGITAA